MTGLSISGGGGQGSFALAVAEYLNKKYDVIAGNSTGTLAAPFIALGEYELAKEGYFLADNKTIYKICPFDKAGRPRIGLAIKRGLTGHLTIGDTTPLQAWIRKHFTLEMFIRLRSGHTRVYIALHNLNTDVNDPELSPLEVICSHDSYMTYELFTAYMYASCLMVPFASVAEIKGNQYADGGLSEVVLTDFLIELGVKELDVIMLRPVPKRRIEFLNRINSMWELIVRVWQAMRKDLEYENLHKLISIAKATKLFSLHVYYLPFKLTDNSMHFSPEKQKYYYEIGCQYADSAEIVRQYGYDREMRHAARQKSLY